VLNHSPCLSHRDALAIAEINVTTEMLVTRGIHITQSHSVIHLVGGVENRSGQEAGERHVFLAS